MDRKLKRKQYVFSTIGETWNEYQLDNGKTARVKFVLTKVFETEAKLPNGQPIYTFESTPVFVIDE